VIDMKRTTKRVVPVAAALTGAMRIFERLKWLI